MKKIKNIISSIQTNTNSKVSRSSKSIPLITKFKRSYTKKDYPKDPNFQYIKTNKKDSVSIQSYYRPLPNVYGFKWANNSCAFDSYIIILFYMYKSINNQIKQEFFRYHPTLINFFNIMSQIPDNGSWSQIKTDMLNLVYDTNYMRQSGFHLGQFISISTVYFALKSTSNLTQETLQTHMDLTLQSNNQEYSMFECKFNKSFNCHAEVQQSTFHDYDSCSNEFPNPNSTIVHSAQSFIDKKFKQMTYKQCQTCPIIPKSYNYDILKLPYILRIDLELYFDCLFTDNFYNTIDTVIVKQIYTYKLFAILYYKNRNHYFSRFKSDNAIYEYDGMKNVNNQLYKSNCIEVQSLVIRNTVLNQMRNQNSESLYMNYLIYILIT
jgi:hypothetical protein